MPTIHEINCDHCGFQISEWNTIYAIDANGEQVECGFGYFNDPEKVTGLPLLDAFQQGRIGHHLQCVCLKCFCQFTIDFPHEPCRWQIAWIAANTTPEICPCCGSSVVTLGRDMIGKECPVCREGAIDRRRPIMHVC